MNHKLKSLGVALVAVFALGAMVASSASAAAGFTGTTGKAITGAQTTATITSQVKTKHEFFTNAGTVKCEEATFSGTAVASEATQQALTPLYGKCTLAGAVPVQVTMNGCSYLFKGVNTVSGSASTITATADVVCGAGAVIDVHATAAGNNCHIKIGAQTGLGSLELHNRGTAGTSSADIEATIDVINIGYTVHGSECPNAPNTTLTTNGTYKGGATIQSTTSSTGVQVH
jgi:hypothetical protein